MRVVNDTTYQNEGFYLLLSMLPPYVVLLAGTPVGMIFVCNKNWNFIYAVSKMIYIDSLKTVKGNGEKQYMLFNMHTDRVHLITLYTTAIAILWCFIYHGGCFSWMNQINVTVATIAMTGMVLM